MANVWFGRLNNLADPNQFLQSAPLASNSVWVAVCGISLHSSPWRHARAGVEAEGREKLSGQRKLGSPPTLPLSRPPTLIHLIHITKPLIWRYTSQSHSTRLRAETHFPAHVVLFKLVVLSSTAPAYAPVFHQLSVALRDQGPAWAYIVCAAASIASINSQDEIWILFAERQEERLGHNQRKLQQKAEDQLSTANRMFNLCLYFLNPSQKC